MTRAIALLMLLTGCPDPVPSTDAASSGAAQAGAAAPAAPPDGGGAPPAGAGRPAAPGFQVEPGQGVKITGTVTYPGTATGTYRIDFLRAAEGAGFPELLHSLSMDKPGTWEVEAPKSAGKVHVVSYLDAAEDGPSAGEPAVLYGKALDIESDPITDVALVLSDDPDLGDFAPRGGGGAPPGPPTDAGAAAGGTPPAAPTDGAAPTGAPTDAAGGAPPPDAPTGAAPAPDAASPAAPTTP